MPHTINAVKRMRQNRKRNERNHAVKTAVKTQIKKVLEAIETKDVEKAKAELKKAASMLDKAAQKGILHSRNADRRKARLAGRVQSLAKS